MWPFVGHRVDRNKGQEAMWYFWPFVGRRTGEQIDGRYFWPVYTTERRGKSHRVKFVWPIGWWNRAEIEGEEFGEFYIAPVFSSQWRGGREDGRRSWMVWPLVKYRREKDGEVAVEFPSLLPRLHFGPWERNYAPFFRLFEYHRSAEGKRSWRVFRRLIRVDRGPEDRYIEVTPLFRFSSHGGEKPESGWSVLKGLVGSERRAGRKSWRFLYFLRTGGREKVVEGTSGQ